MLEIITKLHLLGKHKGINMLREPTPGFMLDVIERLRQEGHPQTNLEINIQWLVTGEKRPIGCPPGHREDKFLERLEIMREKCVKRLANLIPENQNTAFLKRSRRLNEGVSTKKRIDEVVFNNSLSMHFENNEEDHALIRWLLEGEFLETDIDDEPNRTLVKGLEKILFVKDYLCTSVLLGLLMDQKGQVPWVRLLDCYVIGYEANTSAVVR